MITRTPGVTAVVVLTLALGIGANAVVFSAIDALLLQRSPAGQPDELVHVYSSSTDAVSYSSSSYPDYVDLRDSNLFSGITAFGGIRLGLAVGDVTTEVGGELVSGNYFDVIQVSPVLGRGFADAEDVAGRPVRVAIVSDRLWRDRLGANPEVPGLTVRLNGELFTVIGVLPRGFTGPVLGRVSDIWLPAALQQEVRPPSAGLMRALGSADLLGQRSPRWLNMIARLQPGQTVSEVTAGLNTIATRLQRAYPDSNEDLTFTAVSLRDGPGVRQQAAPMLYMLGTMVAIVLLIACTNIASLMVGRAVARRHEMAVRMALGSRPQRLARQWLTESVLLASIGGAAGLVVTWLGIPLLYRIGFPETIAVTINARVVLAAMALTGLTGLLFGLAPVLETLRRNTVEALRDETTNVAAGRHASRLRRGFVIAQVTLSLVLLTGSGLFVRSLQAARGVDLGYDIEGVVLGSITPGTQYDEVSGQVLYRDLLDRVRGLPGVEGAAYARVTVLSGAARTVPVAVDEPAVGENALPARTNVVSDGYFDTLGIQVLRGRAFAATDTMEAPLVAVVTESMATAFFGSDNPVGERFYHGPAQLEVIGVVADNVYVSALEPDPPPVFYRPLAQYYESGVTLHIRRAGAREAGPLGALVQGAVQSLDQALLFANVRTLTDEFDRSLGQVRLMATLVGSFGALAVLLAAIGLYGVMANATEQRRPEISLRLALGASPGRILALVLKQGLGLVALGTALGLAGAAGLSRLVESELFGVSPTDPATYAGVVVLLLVIAAAACAVPALRAMRVDPIHALRGQ